MKIDGGLTTFRLTDVPAIARETEALGYDGLYTFEGKWDPFLPLVLAAEHTTRLELATGIALAFTRSPMHLAYLGHDLQLQSQGRFILGLGSQIKTHVEKRYSSVWSHPAARMRELVQAVQAIWRNWNEGVRLDFRGRFYTHTLMTPIFDPGGSEWGPPRIFLAGVQPRMITVAGEVADGILVHPFHSRRFVDERVVPMLTEGLAKATRPRAACAISAQAIVVTGSTDEERGQSAMMARGQLAFYGSTPQYKPVLDVHGWGDLQPELHALSKQGRWMEMGDLITDDMLETFALCGTLEELPAKVAAKYAGLADRVAFVAYGAVDPTNRDRWRAMLDQVRRIRGGAASA